MCYQFFEPLSFMPCANLQVVKPLGGQHNQNRQFLGSGGIFPWRRVQNNLRIYPLDTGRNFQGTNFSFFKGITVKKTHRFNAQPWVITTFHFKSGSPHWGQFFGTPGNIQRTNISFPGSQKLGLQKIFPVWRSRALEPEEHWNIEARLDQDHSAPDRSPSPDTAWSRLPPHLGPCDGRRRRPCDWSHVTSKDDTLMTLSIDERIPKPDSRVRGVTWRAWTAPLRQDPPRAK